VTSSAHTGFSNNLRKDVDPVRDTPGKIRSLRKLGKNIYKSADASSLPKGVETRVFHRTQFSDQTKVIRTANAYADFIIEQERECRGRNQQDGVPASEIIQTLEGLFVINNAAYAHMQHQAVVEDLNVLQKELEDIVQRLQDDKMKRTQFRDWSTHNQPRNMEAFERCFHSHQQPKLQHTETLQKLSQNLTRFLKVGGKLWLDKITSYSTRGVM
jgi:hypothetical protein